MAQKDQNVSFRVSGTKEIPLTLVDWAEMIMLDQWFPTFLSDHRPMKTVMVVCGSPLCFCATTGYYCLLIIFTQLYFAQKDPHITLFFDIQSLKTLAWKLMLERDGAQLSGLMSHAEDSIKMHPPPPQTRYPGSRLMSHFRLAAE